MYYQISSHYKDVKLYVLDPFICKGQQAFESIQFQSVYSQDRIKQKEKEHLLIWNSETNQNLAFSVYLYNYQTETAIFLAKKHEKTIMACSYINFLNISFILNFWPAIL